MKKPLFLSIFQWVALWLACATVSKGAADKSATEGLTAQQIVANMGTAYATCKSYRDSGVVTNYFKFDRRAVVKPFRTAFVRPNLLRFEYDDSTPDKRYVVWAKGGDVRTWWYLRPGVKQESSLDLAIAGATGVSGGSAHTVPTLLLPDRISGRKLTSMNNLNGCPTRHWTGRRA